VDYSALKPDELVLTCLRTGGEPAWQEFVRRFHPLITRVVFRTAGQWGEGSPQVIDDLVQDTYLKLCADRERLLRTFKPDHPDAIYGYIKVFTANLVHDRFKAAHSQKRGGNALTTSIDDDGGAGLERSAHAAPENLDRSLLIHEIDGCLRTLPPGPAAARDRRIFWLYYRVGLSASGIASLPKIGLGTKGVESTLLRLTRYVRERLVPRVGESGTTQQKGIRMEESL
jgi:RNA polymerase sigma-70 factor (ECF subfamily)